MRAATSSKPSQRSGREWLLAWLVCGSLSSVAALAQSEAETPSEAATDLVAADPNPVVADRDPVRTNQELLNSTVEQYGRKSLQTAEAYMDLADAQRQAKQYEQAAESYLAAVEAYRSVACCNLGDGCKII